MRLAAVLPLFFLALAACSDGTESDSEIPPPLGGGGTTAGNQGGAAGSESAGAGGESGTSGQGGDAGSTGGSGGATGGVSGSSGQGGDAGSAGEGGAAGDGGQGGESGTSGQAGEGGSDLGGSGGSEAGGDAGAGGSDAGSGGTNAGAGGSDAGAGGSDAGAGGDAGSDAGGSAGANSGGAGGSSNAGSGGAGGALPTPNLAFVTSVAFNPVQTAAEADKLCVQLAAQAGLPSGNYVAWLSTSGVDAKDKLANASGWVRVDGLPFANTVGELIDGRIFYPLRVDETGTTVPQNTPVATGTLPNGLRSTLDCEGWTKESADYFAGDAASGTALWTERNQANCAQPARYYCFQIDFQAQVAPPPVPADGRRIFTTSEPFVPSAGGLASADAQCNQEAQKAGLTGTYKALLATNKASAASRIQIDKRAWFRPDGVRVADPKKLLDKNFNDLAAPPNVTADASDYVDFNAWTGDSSPSEDPPNGLTCSDWTLTDGPTFQGVSGPTDSTWFAGALTSCSDTLNRLRCAED